MERERAPRESYDRAKSLQGKVAYFDERSVRAKAESAALKSPEGIAFLAKIEENVGKLKASLAQAEAALA